MKAVQVTKPGVLEIIDIAEPILSAADEVKVRMTAAGVCGSDVHIYHGTNAAATYPRIIGHEMVGIIESIGKEVKTLAVGDRVIVDQVISCGACIPCKKGRGNICDNLQVRGVHVDGGFQEAIVVPAHACHRLPSTLTDIDAVLIEPTTIAIQACARAALERDDFLVILGYGALGSSILTIARELCDNILVADINEEKLQGALGQGAAAIVNLNTEDLTEHVKKFSGGHGATVSIDAVCNKTSLLSLLQATGNGGRVITMGFSTEPVEINQFLITSKELDVRGSRLQNRMFTRAIELIESGSLSLTGRVSHTFALTRAQDAFDFIDSGDRSIRKVVLTFNQEELS